MLQVMSIVHSNTPCPPPSLVAPVVVIASPPPVPVVVPVPIRAAAVRCPLRRLGRLPLLCPDQSFKPTQPVLSSWTGTGSCKPSGSRGPSGRKISPHAGACGPLRRGPAPPHPASPAPAAAAPVGGGHPMKHLKRWTCVGVSAWQRSLSWTTRSIADPSGRQETTRWSLDT